MDFDIGKNSEHRYICMDCDEPIYVSKLENTVFTQDSVPHLQYYWISRLKEFYNIYKPVKWFFAIAFPLLLILAVGFSIKYSTRKYVNILITLLVLFTFLANRIPLDLYPASNRNAITNGGNKYRGAGRITLLILITTIIITISTELIRSYFQEGYTCFTKLNQRSDRVTKYIASTILVVVPIFYIIYVTVSDTYTMAGSPLHHKHIRSNGKTTMQAVKKYMSELPTTNDESKKMKYIWLNRKKVMKNTYY